MNEVKEPIKFEKNGIEYATYEWKGHKITFLAEDVEVYEWYLLNELELAIPLYVHQGCLGRDEESLTDEEVKEAVLTGMNSELGLYNIGLKEQPKQWKSEPGCKYNEMVGIRFFREPMELTDAETAYQHKNQWCILQRYQDGKPPRVVCFTDGEKYAERIRSLFIKKYLGKGFELFFHRGNGEGTYEQFEGDDKSILAEYEENGIHFYSEPQETNWFKYIVKYHDCFCVVAGKSGFEPESKLVCFATEPQYNEKLREIYEWKYREMGYFLITEMF